MSWYRRGRRAPSAFAANALAQAADGSRDAVMDVVARLPRPLVLIAPTHAVLEAAAQDGWVMAVESSFEVAGALRARGLRVTCSDPVDYLSALGSSPPASIFVDLLARPTSIGDGPATIEAAAASLAAGGRLGMRVADAGSPDLAAAAQLVPSLPVLGASTVTRWLAACDLAGVRIDAIGGALVVEAER